MEQYKKTLAALLTVLPVAGGAETLGEVLAGGATSLDLRYRYEQVDQQNLPETAGASTVRTRLGYATAELSGLSAYIEMEDVHKVGTADYTTPGAGALATPEGPKKPGHPVVADPLAAELNQSYLQYRRGGSTLRYGRQRIIRGAARFVGNVGWRQNEQTFDAFSFENTSIEDLKVFAAYISDRNTVTFTDIDMDTMLLDIAWAGVPGGALSARYYDIQLDRSPAQWETAGLRYEGGASAFTFALEYARQEQANGAEPDYSRLEAGYDFGALKLGAGVETLGSDSGTAFATPLATLHAFNGWADQFLATPAAGLEDRFVSIGAGSGGVDLLLVLHDFSTDIGGVDLGEEVDLLAVKSLSKQWKAGVKFAGYSAGEAASGYADVDKFWLWTEFGF